MKINLTEQSIFNAIKKAFLNEKRAVNDHILEYTVKPGAEKNGKISTWFLNFYISNDVCARMQQLIKTAKGVRNFGNFIQTRKTDKQEPGREMEMSLRLIHPEGMIDEKGNVNQDSKTAAGQSVALIGTFYNIYTAANNGEKPSESLKSIVEDVTRTIKHKITGAACSNAVKSAYELWQEFCEKLGSNEVQEIIKNLSISYDDDTIIDHRLSVGNKLRALGQAKKYGMNITYLATASNWRMMLNRQVNPNANPIFLIIPWKFLHLSIRIFSQTQPLRKSILFSDVHLRI